MNTLCEKQNELSHDIARAFIRYMYDGEDTDAIYFKEIYFIWDDPTGTLWYADHFWSLSTMYEVLLKSYHKDDVWNWYYYTLENCWENREAYLSLSAFCGLYKGYTWELSEIYKLEIEKHNKNKAYWQSPEWKAETDRTWKEATDKFINLWTPSTE